MAKWTRAVAAGALLVLLSGTTTLLSGCVGSATGTAASSSAATPAPGATSTQKPDASSASEPTAEPLPSAEPTPRCMRADGGGIILPSGLLNVDLYSRMHDYGAREGAAGTAQYADDGSLASYVVASGDFTDAILERFCVGFYYLDSLNAVRRGGGGSVDPTRTVYQPELHVGDTLNLSPYTITTVGDVNGEVFAYETSFTLPPQR